MIYKHLVCTINVKRARANLQTESFKYCYVILLIVYARSVLVV